MKLIGTIEECCAPVLQAPLSGDEAGQLAATLGLPGMPLTDLASGVSLPIPGYQYDKVLAYVLAIIPTC